jgi:hypothetical protein
MLPEEHPPSSSSSSKTITTRSYVSAENSCKTTSSSTREGVYCWGLNTHQQLLLPPLSSNTSTPLVSLSSENRVSSSLGSVVDLDCVDDVSVFVSSEGSLYVNGIIRQAGWAATGALKMTASSPILASTVLPTTTASSDDGINPHDPKPLPLPSHIRVTSVHLGSSGRILILSESGQAYRYRVYAIPPSTASVPRSSCGRLKVLPLDKVICGSAFGERIEIVSDKGDVHLHFDSPVPLQPQSSNLESQALTRGIALTYIPTPHRVKSISCAIRHTVICTSTGQVLCRGDASLGRLGLGPDAEDVDEAEYQEDAINNTTKYPFRPVDGKSTINKYDIKIVHASRANTIAVSACGKVYSWGSNGPLLGFGAFNPILSPEPIATLNESNVVIKRVTMGCRSVIATSDAGNVYVWGVVALANKGSSWTRGGINNNSNGNNAKSKPPEGVSTITTPILLEYFAASGLRVAAAAAAKSSFEELPNYIEGSFHSLFVTSGCHRTTLEERGYVTDLQTDISPEHCVAYGAGIFKHTSHVAGVTHTFTIGCRNVHDEDLVTSQPNDRYRNELIVTMTPINPTTVSNESIHFKHRITNSTNAIRPHAITTTCVDNNDGTWTVTYLCASGGKYNCSVGFRKVSTTGTTDSSITARNRTAVEPIKDSPFNINIGCSQVNPSCCLVHGDVVYDNTAKCGGTTRMLIQLYSSVNVPCRGGGHNVKVTMSPEQSHTKVISSPLGKRISTVEYAVEDHGDGFYTATAALTKRGDYNLWVRVGGWAVQLNNQGTASSFITQEEGDHNQGLGFMSDITNTEIQGLMHVNSFPRKITVLPARPHASTSSIDLSDFFSTADVATPDAILGNVKTSANSLCRFSLHIRDIFGNYAQCYRNQIEVYIRYDNDGDSIDVAFSVIEKKFGVYDIEFRPSSAGVITVNCFVLGLQESSRHGGAGGGDGEVDPYDHQYDEGFDSTRKNTTDARKRVQITGCPFKVFVREIPIARRLCAQNSTVHLLANRLSEGTELNSVTPSSLSSYCWTRASTISSGGVAFIKLRMRDKANNPMNFDSLSPGALDEIVTELKGLIRVDMKKVESFSVMPVFKVNSMTSYSNQKEDDENQVSPPFFQLTNIPEMDQGGFASPRAAMAGNGCSTADSLGGVGGAGGAVAARRQKFASKFKAAQQQPSSVLSYASTTTSEAIPADFELELNSESFKMLTMIGDGDDSLDDSDGDDDSRPASSAYLDSVLVKVAMPLLDDLFTLSISFANVATPNGNDAASTPFKSCPLLVSVVPQIGANFVTLNEHIASIDAGSRINDGFMFLSSVECHFGPHSGIPPSKLRMQRNSLGGGATSSFDKTFRLQMLPRHILAAPRVYHEIKQLTSAHPPPLALTVDARSDPKLSQLAVNAINLLGCLGPDSASSESDQVVNKLRILLMFVVNFTGGVYHDDKEQDRTGKRERLRKFWESVADAQKNTASLVLSAGEVCALLAKSGACASLGDGRSSALLVLRAVLFKYICDRCGINGCGVVKRRGGCACRCEVKTSANTFVVDFSSLVVLQDNVKSPSVAPQSQTAHQQLQQMTTQQYGQQHENFPPQQLEQESFEQEAGHSSLPKQDHQQLVRPQSVPQPQPQRGGQGHQPARQERRSYAQTEFSYKDGLGEFEGGQFGPAAPSGVMFTSSEVGDLLEQQRQFLQQRGRKEEAMALEEKKEESSRSEDMRSSPSFDSPKPPRTDNRGQRLSPNILFNDSPMPPGQTPDGVKSWNADSRGREDDDDFGGW